MSQARGLLLAMMEPPPAMEEEFQDWYDTEHFPERAECEGFLTASRFVCIDGWPRYLALYDLADTEVLRGPGYAKIAGERYSPWTHRIVSRVWGQYRADAAQVVSRARHCWATVAQRRGSRCGVSGMHRRRPRRRSSRACGRCMRIGPRRRSCGCSAPTSRTAPTTSPSSSCARRNGETDSPAATFGDAARYVDLFNVYVPYTRRSAGAFPKGARITS